MRICLNTKKWWQTELRDCAKQRTRLEMRRWCRDKHAMKVDDQRGMKARKRYCTEGNKISSGSLFFTVSLLPLFLHTSLSICPRSLHLDSKTSLQQSWHRMESFQMDTVMEMMEPSCLPPNPWQKDIPVILNFLSLVVYFIFCPSLEITVPGSCTPVSLDVLYSNETIQETWTCGWHVFLCTSNRML